MPMYACYGDVCHEIEQTIPEYEFEKLKARK
jgi:hypothetical protein